MRTTLFGSHMNAPSRLPRQYRRGLHASSLIAAVAGLLVFLVAAGALFLTLRYDTPRIAVGPPWEQRRETDRCDGQNVYTRT